MDKITGNNNDFPTIKQVNDALGGNNGGYVLDITNYAYNIMNLYECDIFQQHNNSEILNLCKIINNGNYNRIKSTDGLIIDAPMNIIGNNFSKYWVFEWYNIDGFFYKTILSLNSDNYKTIKII